MSTAWAKSRKKLNILHNWWKRDNFRYSLMFYNFILKKVTVTIWILSYFRSRFWNLPGKSKKDRLRQRWSWGCILKICTPYYCKCLKDWLKHYRYRYLSKNPSNSPDLNNDVPVFHFFLFYRLSRCEVCLKQCRVKILHTCFTTTVLPIFEVCQISMCRLQTSGVQ